MGKKRKRPTKTQRLEKAAQNQEPQQHTDKKPNIQGNAEDGIEKSAENNTEKSVEENNQNIEKIVEENVEKNAEVGVEKNVEVSTQPVIVFAHGAGAPSTCEWMQRWKVTLASATEAVEVITFDYPYFSGGKRGAPPKAEKLVGFHVEKVKEAAAKYPGHPVVLAGKSMGARVSCMVSVKGDVDIKAVLCLGYPLKGMDGSIRDGTLLELAIPTLFVQGSKDSLCPLEKLETVRKKMRAENELVVVEGGDHSLIVGKKALKEQRRSQADVEMQTLLSVRSFLEKAFKCQA